MNRDREAVKKARPPSGRRREHSDYDADVRQTVSDFAREAQAVTEESEKGKSKSECA